MSWLVTVGRTMTERRFWLQTLGCPKNEVDSEKLAGLLVSDGLSAATAAAEADLVVVNTCAFIEAARQESVDAILTLAEARRPGARLVVTGCMAERYGDELAAALPEVDLVAGFGASLRVASTPVTLGGARRAGAEPVPSFDLLNLPRPASGVPWAYLKVAEGCDRSCGFCAIPSFRGRQRSRTRSSILAEAESLAAGGVREIVLVAQDLASFGLDRSPTARRGMAGGSGRSTPIVELTRAVSALVPRTRLLYLYPSRLTDELITAVLDTGVPYFDLSLQHVARPLLARMRRWGDGERFLERIAKIRAAEPGATFRSSFILGYPGETESDHDELLEFIRLAELDWAGFFPFSLEEGTPAATLPDQVPAPLALERLRECAELQDEITAGRRDALVGTTRSVLVDEPGRARSVAEAPEIDGLIRVPDHLDPGCIVEVEIIEAVGPDLVGRPRLPRAGEGH
jgi:ribosomal protein S12 methylthiotransferase